MLPKFSTQVQYALPCTTAGRRTHKFTTLWPSVGQVVEHMLLHNMLQPAVQKDMPDIQRKP